jgi:hypothetical protein
MAVTYTIRQATTTNVVNHQYVTATSTYQVTRYFNRFDLTGWDEASSANFNGTTEDGSILVSWLEADIPPTLLEE